MPDYTYTLNMTMGAGIPSHELTSIPGVRLFGRRWVVAWHAVPAVMGVHARWGREPSFTRIPQFIPAPGGELPWDVPSGDHRPSLLGVLQSRGEVRESYLIEWPTRYQKEAIGFAAIRPGTLFHHPTGSGKTYSAIVWSLLATGPVVVLTLAAVRTQYARAYERFTMLSVFVCQPQSERRKRDRWGGLGEYLDWCWARGQRPVVVAGWESLPDHVDGLERLLRNARDWTATDEKSLGTLVMDESVKGKGRRRWECVDMPDKATPAYARVETEVLRRGGKVKEEQHPEGLTVYKGMMPLGNVVDCASRLSKAAARRLATTATPIPDRTRDVWGQLDLIEPWAWGSYRQFVFRYCDGHEGTYNNIDDRGQSNVPELSRRLGCVFHVVSTEEARRGLPSKRRQTWFIPKEEQVAPLGGWKRMVAEAKKQGDSAMLILRLQMAASVKRPALIRRIKEHIASSHKIVVFTGLKRDAEAMAQGLRGLKGPDKKKVPVWLGTGEDSRSSREKMLAAYIASDGPCVLVGTGDAWGTGIDGMQCTDVLFLAQLPYTPGDLDQQEGRVSGRLGQTRSVLIYYPIAEGTADEHLASILLEKLPAVGNLVLTESLDGAIDALSGHEHDPAKFAATVLAAFRAAEDS